MALECTAHKTKTKLSVAPHSPIRPRPWSLLLIIVLTIPAIAQIRINEAAHNQFVLAYRLYQKGETILAAEAFDEYLGKYADAEKRGDALYYRALLAHEAGEQTRAASLLENVPATKLLEAHLVLLLRGKVLTDLHQYKEALRCLEGISIDPLGPITRSSLFYLRGLAYRGAKNPQAAAAALSKAAEIDGPLRARALLDLARVQLHAQDRDGALTSIRQCLDVKDPSATPEAACLGADLSFEMGRYDDAIKLYEIVVNGHQSSPHFESAIEGVFWSYYQAKLYEVLLDAFNVLKETIPGPRRVTIWYLAASAHQELGNHGAASANLEAILFTAAASPIHDKVLYKLAVSQFERR